MEKTATIKSGGREYPCFPTMGAMLRYERMTGRRYADSEGSVSEAVERLYCLVCSACESLGQEKPSDLQAFADGIAPEDFSAWAMAQAGDRADGGGEDGKKA